MKIEDYPPQEPLSDFGQRYQETCFAMSEQIGAIERFELQLGDNPYQSMTVFPSKQPSGLVLGWMFGGGWTNGYKEMMSFMAPPLTAAGITFATIGYRLAPASTFPANVDDVSEALKWIANHIGDVKGDSERVFIGGHSAGAHLAALLGTRRDLLAQKGLPEGFLKGVLPISATYDFSTGCGLAQRPRFLGPQGLGHEIAASPLFHVDCRSAPFMLSWGTHDFAHLRQQALKFAEVLAYRGVPFEALEMEGCDHLEVAYEAANTNGPWLSRALDFMAIRAAA